MKHLKLNGVMPQFAYLKQSFLLLILFAVSASLYSQAPERFSYQAVIRDLSNDPIADTDLGMQITIYQGTPGGSNVFRETQTVSTNSAGLLSLEIGDGTNANGSISVINWSAGPFYIELEIDPAGGTNYIITSTTKLLSVPYALFADKAIQAERADMADVANAISTAGSSQFELPVGTILPFAGPASAIPTNWLLCDGTTYQTGSYPALFTLIQNSYDITTNAGQFAVPNFKGRNPVGMNSIDPNFASLGNRGGEKNHTLTTNEMPSHNHTGTTSSDGSHSHKTFYDSGAGGAAGNPTSPANEMFTTGDAASAQCSGCAANIFGYTSTASNHSHTLNIGNRGGGASHNVLDPYLVINFIIKAR